MIRSLAIALVLLAAAPAAARHLTQASVNAQAHQLWLQHQLWVWRQWYPHRRNR